MSVSPANRSSQRSDQNASQRSTSTRPTKIAALSGADIRQKFLAFYEKKGHQILDSASLVPDDPTVLLTIAGMLPFKPIFLGQQKAEFDRATTAQKCIRTNDIENVGRTARHHTFFEMLGNFSFGDYFKKEAIAWAWEISIEVFGLPPERIVPSVFKDDDEAFAIWRDDIGIAPNRIIRMGEADNFWKSGPTGPCGPCSELYYDFHPEQGDDNIDLEDDERFIEYYNLVFMQYNRDAEGNLAPLQAQNIDTGLGLERMAQILQGVPNNYETDLIFPIIQTAAEIASIDYHQADNAQKISLKVIGDHVRSVMHMVTDGITASNVGRGYVLRRLIRRVVRHGRLLGISEPFTTQVAETSIALSEEAYPAVRKRENAIKRELEREETQFLKTLERGEKRLADILADKPKQVSGQDAFELYDTYGFPLELTQEIAEESGIIVDEAGFNAEMEQQRQRSKEAHETIDLTVQGSLDTLASEIEATDFIGYEKADSQSTVEAILVAGNAVPAAETGSEVQVVLNQTPFYAESGGQIGDRGYLTGENLVIRIEDVKKEGAFFVHFGKVERGTLRKGDNLSAKIDRACRRRAQANHTATHLLQAALKALVNESISQAGSLVDFDRLRFDFHAPQALTPEQIQQVEKQVNTWISEAHSADVQTMPIADAKAKGATAMFGEKYGDEVRVVDYPGVSMELCGGTHVGNTAEIGVFKIISETGIAAGIRRIEAVAGPAVLDYLEVRDAIVRDLSAQFKTKPEEITTRVTNLQNELRAAQKELSAAKSELALTKSDQLLDQAETIGNVPIIVANLDAVDPDALKTAAERLLQKLGDGAVVLGSVPSKDKVSLVAAFSKPVISKGLQAGKFIGGIAKLCGGGGGGRPNFAQAGGRDASKLPDALETAKAQIKSVLS
ncbi:MAG: alanine--tRNA ligase [Cyanobacteria bacterium P01_D01_bin.105]